jgi:GTPase
MCAAEAMPKSFATWTFEADVVVLHHTTTIAAKYFTSLFSARFLNNIYPINV